MSVRARRALTVAALLASAVILGFADPDFGMNASSLRLVIALAVSVAALGLLHGWATGALARRWWQVDWGFALRPGGMLLLVAGVIVTRALGLEPGIVLGVWLGATLSRSLDRRHEGRLVLATTAMVTALGLAAWVGYSIVTPIAAADPGFTVLLVQEVLATLTLEALTTFVVLLLPLALFDGLALWRWSPRVWLAAYAAHVAVFVLVVLPLPGHWEELRVPGAVFVVVFVALLLLALVLRAWFRRRPAPAPAPVTARETAQ